MKKEQKLEQQQNSDSTADNSQVSPLAQNRMLSDAGAELLNPRFEVIAEYPKSEFKKGGILKRVMYATNDVFHTDINASGGGLDLNEIIKYPHLFRKMNWWEKRTAEEMPKKVKSLADNKGDVFDIQEWDMELLVGWIDKKERSCCSLLTFKPEYGYVPVS